ncbi:FG-GAP repeat protein [Endozoicomonas lisbonensis]|uniref:FG-GAP repeat protein n=1 Tax=Endozoicomonas lisbonensis TaxID=3120522 RepID=UPI003392C7B1
MTPATNPFEGNYQLVQSNDIAMVWTAPAAGGKTPIDTAREFPQSLQLAAATYSAKTDNSESEAFISLDQKAQALPASFQLNTFYNQSAFSFNLDVVAGDINGDGRSDLVIASYNAKEGKVIIHAGVGETSEILKSLSNVKENDTEPRMAISMAIADYDDDEKDEVMLVWVDTHLNIQYIDFEDNKPRLGTIYQGDAFKNNNFYPQVASTAGNYSGDGVQLAVAWSKDAGSSSKTTPLVLQIFHVGENGVLEEKTRVDKVGNLAIGRPAYQSDKPYVAGQIDLASGDLNGNQADEVIVAWSRASDSHNIRNQSSIPTVTPELTVYSITPDLLSHSQLGSLQAKEEWDYTYTSVAVSDFNLDLVNEVVVGTAGTLANGESKLAFNIYSYDLSASQLLANGGYQSKDFIASERTNWPDGSFWSLLDVQVGDLNGDLTSEIVAAWRPSDQTCVTCASLGVFSVATDLKKITETKARTNKQQILGYSSGPNKWIGGHLSVALGDFSGNSVRVGPPKKFRRNATRQILALINEPPKHEDWWMNDEGKVTDTLNVNNNRDSYVLYQNKLSTSTNMQLDISRDWSYSDKTSLSLGKKKLAMLKSSIEKTYGNNFTKKFGSIQSLEFGSNAYAEMDDYVVLLELGYTVWEYPTYTGPDSVPDKPEGTIMVVFPDRPDNSGVIRYIPGNQPGSYYKPNHETANLLSYSSKNPVDVITKDNEGINQSYVLLNQNEFTLGPAGKADEYVSWEEVKTKTTSVEQSQEITRKQGFNGSFTKFISFGLDIETQSKYTEKQLSTLDLSYQDSTSIHIYLSSFPDRDYSFSVTPWVYWSQLGYLVVDYKVDIPDTREKRGWYKTYGELPDPAFALPMRSKDLTDPYRQYSREIGFDLDESGKPVAIEAQIHNYSLLDNSIKVAVRCYDGDPATGGKQIDKDVTVQLAGKQTTKTARLTWSPDDSETAYKIYCVIDPDNTLKEIHEWNNTAWANWPMNEVNE